MACSHENCGINEHENMEDEFGLRYSLYNKINLDMVECLNEAEFGSGARVFKVILQ